jgi:hypothetical protein
MPIDFSLITDHADMLLPAGAAAGGAVASLSFKYLWDRHLFRSRNGYNIVNASLSTLQAVEDKDGDGETAMQLEIDVLFESQLQTLLDNKYAIKVVTTAARKAKRSGKPLLNFGKDHWFILNGFLCELSEKYSQGFLTKGLASPVKTEVSFVFALTYESWPNMRQGKVRLIMAPENQLKPELFKKKWNFKSSSHADRKETLSQICDDWHGSKTFCRAIRLPILHTAPI